MDNFNPPAGSVGAGAGQQLHDGRVHSPPARGCHCRRAGPDHSGTATLVETNVAKRYAHEYAIKHK